MRFDSLGAGYTVEEIIDRIYENSKTSVIKLPPQDDPEQIFGDEQETVEEMPFVPLYRSYNRALHAAKERPYQNFRIYYLVRKDTDAMRLYVDSLDLVLGHNLKTGQDVIAYKAEAMRQIDENLKLRQNTRNALKRAERAGDTVEAGKARYNIEVYSRRLSQLRREVTTCDEVLKRSRHVRDNLKRIAENNFRGTYILHKPKNKEKER